VHHRDRVVAGDRGANRGGLVHLAPLHFESIHGMAARLGDAREPFGEGAVHQ
jgi:hypothetical protein